jgi:hypothetical protein
VTLGLSWIGVLAASIVFVRRHLLPLLACLLPRPTPPPHDDGVCKVQCMVGAQDRSNHARPYLSWIASFLLFTSCRTPVKQDRSLEQRGVIGWQELLRSPSTTLQALRRFLDDLNAEFVRLSPLAAAAWEKTLWLFAVEAITSKHLEALRLLFFERGVRRDHLGSTASGLLVHALGTKSVELANMVVNHVEDVMDKQRCLLLAVDLDFWTVMNTLIGRHHADWRAEDGDGHTPICRAAMAGRSHALDFLFGQYMEDGLGEVVLERPCMHDAYPLLFHAIEAGGMSTVVKFLADFKPRGPHTVQSMTVLRRVQEGGPLIPVQAHHLAARLGHFDVLCDLIREGGLDPTAPTAEGLLTPLHLACLAPEPSFFPLKSAMAEFLLEQGASPLARDSLGRTPLDLAEARGRRMMLAAMKKHAGLALPATAPRASPTSALLVRVRGMDGRMDGWVDG